MITNILSFDGLINFIGYYRNIIVQDDVGIEILNSSIDLIILILRPIQL